MLFAARLLIEKGHEHRTPLYWCFVYFEKAYDKVNRDAMWQSLTEWGVPPNMLRLIRSMHKTATTVVKIDGKAGRPFATRSGVRQGCVLSLFLFNLVVDSVVKKVQTHMSKHGVDILYGPDRTALVAPRPRARDTVRWLCLQYAYDSALVCTSQ
eukprot:Lankesteria_metandrocarpae@DN5284_c2_g3_i1.p1